MLRQVHEQGLQLHYVTAREMANIVRAAEDGATGNPHAYRDYWLPRPARVAAGADQTRRLRRAFATASDRECTCSFS